MAKRTYIIKARGYGLTASGELWKLGRYGYLAGYVMHLGDPESAIDNAIEAAEEERRCLMAEAKAEFGW